MYWDDPDRKIEKIRVTSIAEARARFNGKAS